MGQNLRFGILSLATFVVVLLLAVSVSAGTGGPDNKGYRWKDGADAPYGPWGDISGASLPLALGDNADSAAYPLGFGFEFYGKPITQVVVNNNGILMLQNSLGPGFNNADESPEIGGPNQFISGCWRDLRGDNTAQNSGTIHVENTATAFIVQWTAYEHMEAPATETVTFQIQLNPDNTIDVIVNNCSPDTWGAPYGLGIEDATEAHGLNYHFSTDGLLTTRIHFYPNQDPVAADDTGLTTNEDTAIDISVLTNDSDPESDEVPNLKVKDIATAPLHGTASIIESGKKIRYTPAADSNDNFRAPVGPDKFQYTLEDPYGGTDTAWVYVSVTPVNDKPTFVDPGDVIVLEDEPNLDVADWFEDILPAPATALDELDSETVTVTIEDTSVGSNPKLFKTDPSLSPTSFSVFDPKPTSDLSYELNEHRVGFQERKIVLTDSTGLKSDVKVKFIVKPVNDAPSFNVTSNPAILNPEVGEDAGKVFFVNSASPWVEDWRLFPVGAKDEANQKIRDGQYVVTAEFPEMFTASGQPDILEATGVLTFTTAANAQGQSKFWVTLWDDNATATTDDDLSFGPVEGVITIHPTNDPPVANRDTLTYLVGQGTLAIDVVANDTSDPDTGETLQLVPGSLSALGPDDGVADILDFSRIEYTHDGPLPANPVVTFTYDVRDDGQSWMGGSIVSDPKQATGTVEVRLVDLEGIAVPDRYSIDEDTNLRMPPSRGVLANDVGVSSIQGEAVLSAAVSHGALLLNPDGSFDYQPDGDYWGDDFFTYYIDFGDAGQTPSVTVEIAVTPRNDRPYALEDRYRLPPDVTSIVAAPVGLLANDYDVDGDRFIAKISQPPQWGFVTLDEDGRFEYTPPAGFTGEDVFSYNLRDGTGIGGAASVIIIVAENRAPVAEIKLPFDSTAVNRPVKFGQDSYDPDGSGVSYLWDFGNGDTSVEPRPSYTFSTPGEYFITLKVTDDAQAFSTHTVRLLITAVFNERDGGSYNGSAPVAYAGDNQTVLENQRVRLNGTGGDARRAIGFTWTQVGGPEVALSNPNLMTPSFMTPTLQDGKPVLLEFELVIFDAQQLSEPARTSVLVVQTLDKPIVEAGNALSILEGKVVTLVGNSAGFDEGAIVTYTWSQSGGPDLGLGLLRGQSVSLRPILSPAWGDPTTFSFSVTATDGVLTSDADHVDVTVSKRPAAAGFNHGAGIGANANIVEFRAMLGALPVTGVNWDFGDGNTTDVWAPVHGYEQPGEYTVVMTLELADGTTQGFTKTIKVGNDPLDINTADSRDAPALGMLVGLAAFGAVAVAVRKRL